MTGAFNGDRQFALMVCAGAGNTAGKDLCALGNKAAEFCNVFVIDGIDFIDAEAADLPAALASARAAFSVGTVGSIISIVSHENILLSVGCSEI